MGIATELRKISAKALAPLRRGDPMAAAKAIAAVEAALARIADDRARHRATIANTDARRMAALLDDQSTATIRAIEDEARDSEIELDRLALVERELLESLSKLRTDARNRHLQELKTKDREAYAEYVAASRAQLAAYDRAQAMRREFAGAGFEREAAHLPELPGMNLMNADVLRNVENNLDRAINQPVTLPSPPRAAPPNPVRAAEKMLQDPDAMADPNRRGWTRTALRARPGESVLPAPGGVLSVEAAKSAADAAESRINRAEKQGAMPDRERKPGAPLRKAAAPSAPGQVLVSVLRSGIEIEGEKYRAGEIVSVSAEIARAMMRTGAVDLTSPAAEAAPAEGAAA